MTSPHIWEIGPNNTELAVQCTTTLNTLYQTRPSGYRFDLYSPETPLLAEKKRKHFVIGEDLNHLLGYASCFTRRAAKKIENASALLASQEVIELIDHNDKVILPRLLSTYEGYSLYTGKGDTLYIAQLEVFNHRKKLGTQLLNYIKSKRYELIEIEASERTHLPFLKKQDFIPTGTETEENVLVMVWHNPLYR